MCGILLYILLKRQEHNSFIYEAFDALKPRGPDKSHLIKLNDPEIIIGFHRLSIMDLTSEGDQPFVMENETNCVYTICNGEIYNYKELFNVYGFEQKTHSDCEIIPHLYMNHGIDELLNNLIGEFAFVIVDVNKKTNQINVYSARDQYGVRPLFYGIDEYGICFSSELKGQVGVYSHSKNVTIDQFPPSYYSKISYKYDRWMSKTSRGVEQQIDEMSTWTDLGFTKYFHYPQKFTIDVLQIAFRLIYENFVKSVECRLQTDRPLGALLSGGLDSSLVCAVASNLLRQNGKILKTFSVGVHGSSDEHFAIMTAKYIGSNHTHIYCSEKELIDMIPEVVRTCETYDITTVRASLPQLYICKYIRDNYDIKVLLLGDLSDEQNGSYKYFLKAPNAIEFDEEVKHLVNDNHKYDLLRADRCVAGCGLEARVPFSDTRIMNVIMSITPSLRMPKNNIEKWLLRESFKHSGLLPDKILFRSKTAFSDGCTSQNKSLFEIIPEHVEKIITDEYFEKNRLKYTHNTPYTKESLYYREIFESQYGVNPSVSHVIPYFWMPKKEWVGEDVTDPSARTLNFYDGE